MYLLGISAFYHDSAAVIICDGMIVAAAQEERFSRIKNDSLFPFKAIGYCLEQANIAIDDLEAVVFYEKPFLKFERLLETYLRFSPKGIISFLKAIPVWLKQKLFLKKNIQDSLRLIQSYDRGKLRLLFSEHHLSHAASAYFSSPFTEAAILTMDGVGEWATTSIFKASGTELRSLKEIRFPDSLGLLYSCFTYFLGFRVNSGEYKVMGLAPYGNSGDPEVEKFIQIIKTKIVVFHADGSLYIRPSMIDYPTGTKMINDQRWKELFGFPVRRPEAPIESWHCNLAMAIQLVTEECVVRLAKEAKQITGCENLCLAGGVALNCVANSRLHKENIFEKIFIQPAAGDAGGALGAALAGYYIFFSGKRILNDGEDYMKGTYLGPSFNNIEILKSLNKHKLISSEYPDTEISRITAKYLSEGNIVGWFQGRMEFGPRSLGNRSILADPRNPDIQRILNQKIKFREEFRPFAPSVKEEKISAYFDPGRSSPYMNLIDNVKSSFMHTFPDNYESLSWRQKQAFLKSELPAITHADGSSRVQTVSKVTNHTFWNLLDAFEEITGYPILVNTSFNVRGEPIICSPDEAIQCFLKTDMDILVLENHLLRKENILS
jgi:carbamoyltransferase